MRALSTHRRNEPIQRQELVAAAGELLGLFLIFAVAITTRDVFGDTVKAVLIALTWIVGITGAAFGVATLIRGATNPTRRIARIALGAFMIFIGLYSVIHVSS
jgi:uncharacterized membrane protein